MVEKVVSEIHPNKELIGELVMDGDGDVLHHNLNLEDYTKIQNIIKEATNINSFSLKSKIFSHKIIGKEKNHDGRIYDTLKIKEFE